MKKNLFILLENLVVLWKGFHFSFLAFYYGGDSRDGENRDVLYGTSVYIVETASGCVNDIRSLA